MKFSGLFDTVAEKTLKAIDDSIKADNGKTFKEQEQFYFSFADLDAWKADTGELRDHLGASQIGGECIRKVWLNFRCAEGKNDPRLIRLWNRGHLEEMRFLALLKQAGIEVYFKDGFRKGKQFGYANGIFAGSIDGLAYGVPDCENEIVMLEFKTMSDKNFTAFQSKGLSEFQQYERQCYVNMYCMNKFADCEKIFKHLIGDKATTLKSQRIEHTLFLAVNKNTDEIHAVILNRNDQIAEQMLDRITEICDNKKLPEKLSDKSNFYICRMCNYHDFCFGEKELSENCRTCFLQNFDPETNELKCELDINKFSKDCYTGIDFEVR